jgi:hypothetical protein
MGARLKVANGCAIVTAMTHGRANSRQTPRLLIFLALAALLLSFAARAGYVAVGELNEDETDTLQKAWMLHEGETMYLDFLGFRPPLSFQALRPLFWFSQTPSTLIIAARLVQLIWTALAFGFFFLFVDAVAGRRAAWWALLPVACFNFFVVRTAQIRAEPLMLALIFAGLWLFARWRAGDRTPLWAAAAGALLGLASATKYAAPFVALAPALLLVAEAATLRGRRARSAAALGLYAAGGIAAGLGVMLATVGPAGLGEALTRIGLLTEGLRVSEGNRAATWFVTRTFIRNQVLWGLGLVGFVFLHGQAIGAWRRKNNAWQPTLLLLLAYASLAMLVARQKIFQQDLILPGLVLAPAAALLLARRLPLPTAGGRSPHTWKAGALALLLLVGFVGDTAYDRLGVKETIGYYNQVLGAFWGAKTPPPRRTEVDALPLVDFMRGQHDWIRYFPTRTLGESLKLANRIAELTPSGGTVLSSTGEGVVRSESLRAIKTQVFADFMAVEQDEAPGVCRAVRKFIPGACDPTYTPGRRALAALQRRPPDLIVWSFSVADIVAKQPETRTWFEENYRTWFEPAVGAFFSSPRKP